MVFQSYALYPHMTVRENLAFGLRRRAVAARRDRSARPERRGEARARALSRPQAPCPLGRAAAAGGAGPGDRPRPQGVPVRRAAVESRRRAARHHPQRADQAAARARHHDDLCHPRPGRGHDHGRSHLHHEQGRDRPDRQPARGLSQAGRHLRRPLSRQPADEPHRGTARAFGSAASALHAGGIAIPRHRPFARSAWRRMSAGRSPSASGPRTSTRGRRPMSPAGRCTFRHGYARSSRWAPRRCW